MASEGDAPKPNLVETADERNSTEESNNNNTPPVLSAESQIPPPTADTFNNHRHKEHWLNSMRFGVDVLTLFAVAFYAWVAYWQWDAMKRSVDETKRSADAAISAADTAKKTFEEQVKIFQQDQRAWVGPVEIPRPVIKAGTKATFAAIITNAGKTPALNFKTLFAYVDLAPGQNLVPRYNLSKKAIPSVSTLLPSMRMVISIVTEDTTNEEDVRRLATGERVLHAFGQLTYDDVFGRPHSTKFCFYVLTDLTTARSCPEYNEAN